MRVIFSRGRKEIYDREYDRVVVVVYGGFLMVELDEKG